MNMRKPLVPIAIGFALAAAAACSDSATSRLLAPGPLSASKGSSSDQSGGSKDDGSKSNDDSKDKSKDDKDKSKDDDKVSICHAAGRIGTSHYVLITVGAPARYAHIDDHGTPMAGHEEDYYASDDDKKSGTCGGKGGHGTITKTLVDVMTLDAQGRMISDPTWTPGGKITVPANQTRWLEFKLAYSVPTGTTGVVTENETSVCNTMGAADVNVVGSFKIFCSVNYGGATPAGSMSSGVVSWKSLTGTNSILVPIDIHGGGKLCGERTFTNTAVLTLSNGTSTSSSTSTVINFLDEQGRSCGPASITKTLVDVMTLDATGAMVHDATWTPGGMVTVPPNQTRWLEFKLAYSVPTGNTGVVTENETSVCNTMGAADVNVVGSFKIFCSVNYGGANPGGTMSNGVVSWSNLAAIGSILVPIDIHGGGKLCGRRTFTNTAVLTLSNGTTLSSSTNTVMNFLDEQGRSC
jgi:hypothetical protein